MFVCRLYFVKYTGLYKFININQMNNQVSLFCLASPAAGKRADLRKGKPSSIEMGPDLTQPKLTVDPQ